MNDNDLAAFLTRIATIYYERQQLKLGDVFMREAIAQVSEPGLLSLEAIGAIVGAKRHVVVKLWPEGREHPKARGRLNPAHLAYLGYGLSFHHITQDALHSMVDNGTSISTIADLTNISEATLYRWRKRD